MLEQMHRHMKWIMWIIVGLITIAFLFFGIYPSDDPGRVAAKVGDDVITIDEVGRVYQNMYQTYREILKDQFNEAFAKNLKAQALRELITDRLLVQEAKRQGVRVTDEELQASILKLFSPIGKFDQRYYENYLSRNNVTPALFETSQREQLQRQKLERLIEDSVDVSDVELAALFAARSPKAKPGDFEKNKAGFRQSVLQERRRQVLEAFVQGLQQKTAVKVNQKNLVL